MPTTMYRDKGHWTLGDLIDALKRHPDETYVGFRFAGLSVHDIRSYRGCYDHLALEPGSSGSSAFNRVGVLRRALESAVGHGYTGYKGGTYVATRDTILWVACWGESSGTLVTGLEMGAGTLIIKTKQEDSDA